MPLATAATPNLGLQQEGARFHESSGPLKLGFLQVLVKEQLSPLNQTNQPLWSTFCGVTNGVWQGRYAAFYAATGAALLLTAHLANRGRCRSELL